MAEVVAVVNRYALRDAGAFDAAIAALVRAGAVEGHPGVLALSLLPRRTGEARAVVRLPGTRRPGSGIMT